MNTKETALVVQIKNEINKQLGDAETLKSLLATTFKGLEASTAKRAMMEGMLRGFKFVDFLHKNVYAIPFKDSYTLVTSIDYARKIGMKSGVVGKSAPTFEMDGKKIVSCTITIKRKVGDDVGEFTDTVYFDEYYKEGRNGYPSLWDTKPRTMISKVCEMHTLRQACPEEMSQIYTQEEFDKEAEGDYDHSEVADDVVVISTGDDMPGIQGASEVVIPESATERKAMILKELKRIDPSFDMEDEKAARLMVADLTQIELSPKTYGTVIHLLARK